MDKTVERLRARAAALRAVAEETQDARRQQEARELANHWEQLAKQIEEGKRQLFER